MSKSAQLKPLIDTYDLSSRTLELALAELDDRTAGRRTRSGDGSSITFIAGHLLACRCQVLNALGRPTPTPWEDLFGGNASARDASAYPPIAKIARQWTELAPIFRATLESLDDARLAAAAPPWVPVADKSLRGLLQFMSWHEAYHVGQVGLLLTEFGQTSIQARVQRAIGVG